MIEREEFEEKLSKLEGKLDKYDEYLTHPSLQEYKAVARDRARQFEININAMDEEVSTQPAMYSYIGSQWAKARSMRNVAKLEVKTVEAGIKRRIKEQDPRPANKGGISVDQLESMVQTDPQYLQAVGELNDYERLVDQLEIDLDASKQKAQMLYLLRDVISREQSLKTSM